MKKESVWQRKRRHKNKSIAIKYLGGKCIKCSDVNNLEFHHPKEKNFTISNMLQSSLRVIIEEVSKCELLCNKCHIDKRSSIAVHGSLAMYSHHRCRCELCRASWNSWMNEYKKRRKLKSISRGSSMVERQPEELSVGGSSPSL